MFGFFDKGKEVSYFCKFCQQPAQWKDMTDNQYICHDCSDTTVHGALLLLAGSKLPGRTPIMFGPSAAEATPRKENLVIEGKHVKSLEATLLWYAMALKEELEQDEGAMARISLRLNGSEAAKHEIVLHRMNKGRILPLKDETTPEEKPLKLIGTPAAEAPAELSEANDPNAPLGAVAELIEP